MQLVHILSSALADEQLIGRVKVILKFVVKIFSMWSFLWIRIEAHVYELWQRLLISEHFLPVAMIYDRFSR